MKIEQSIIETLKDFGFPSNATKAYISLLKKNPATGYEISARAGIPRSAIYSVLNRLQSLNIINAIGESPKKYVPLSPAFFLEHLSRLNTDRLESLKTAFDTLDLEEEAFDFWHLHGYENLILKMKEAVNSAREKLFLGIWTKDFDAISQQLVSASHRGVDIIIFSFSKIPPEIGTVVCYDLDEEELLKIWKPKVIVVADQEITIMGSALNKPNNRAIWTNNEALTEIATNHIILDITLAGRRLGIEVNPIVERMMKWSDSHLDELIANHKSPPSAE